MCKSYLRYVSHGKKRHLTDFNSAASHYRVATILENLETPGEIFVFLANSGKIDISPLTQGELFYLHKYNFALDRISRFCEDALYFLSQAIHLGRNCIPWVVTFWIVGTMMVIFSHELREMVQFSGENPGKTQGILLRPFYGNPVLSLNHIS